MKDNHESPSVVSTDAEVLLREAYMTLLLICNKAPGYDWNADPQSLTLMCGEMFQKCEALFRARPLVESLCERSESPSRAETMEELVKKALEFYAKVERSDAFQNAFNGSTEWIECQVSYKGPSRARQALDALRNTAKDHTDQKTEETMNDSIERLTAIRKYMSAHNKNFYRDDIKDIGNAIKQLSGLTAENEQLRNLYYCRLCKGRKADSIIQANLENKNDETYFDMATHYARCLRDTERKLSALTAEIDRLNNYVIAGYKEGIETLNVENERLRANITALIAGLKANTEIQEILKRLGHE